MGLNGEVMLVSGTVVPLTWVFWCAARDSNPEPTD